MSFFIAGLFGGVLRGGVGLFKYMTSYKDVEIRPRYFAATILFSGFVGYMSAWIAVDLANFLEIKDMPITFAIVFGYAGGDFIENIFKIIIKQPQLFDFKEKFEKLSSLKDNITKEEKE